MRERESERERERERERREKRERERERERESVCLSVCFNDHVGCFLISLNQRTRQVVTLKMTYDR